MDVADFEIVEPIPELRNPHCIAMLRPWVNVGNVGTIVLGRLGRVYNAQDIGRLRRASRFYDFTRYRPEIRYVNSERVVRVPNTLVQTARADGLCDFIILHMLEPHSQAEDFNDSVLELLRTLGVRRYVLVGGMYDSVPHTRPLLVTGSARGWEPPVEFGGVRLSRSNYQGPTSLTSQLTDRARRDLGIETLSLIVHLPLYLKLEDDYAGAARLLTVLSSLYGFNAEQPEAEMGAQQYGQLGLAMRGNAQLQELVKKFETDYDEQAGQQEPRDVALPPEIEKFLEDVARPDKPENGQPGQGGV